MFYRPGKRRSKIYHDARTLPLRGSGDDEGRYFRCWNCGFRCDVEVDALGDASSRPGKTFEFYYEIYDVADTDSRELLSAQGLDYYGVNGNTILATSSLLRNTIISLKVGVDGQPLTIKQTIRPTVSSGCPVCGTLNWRGDHR